MKYKLSDQFNYYHYNRYDFVDELGIRYSFQIMLGSGHTELYNITNKIFYRINLVLEFNENDIEKSVNRFWKLKMLE
jgi:hypothetical protein